MTAPQKKEPCGWLAHSYTPSHDELKDHLACAARGGCPDCVPCSDRALDMFCTLIHRAARKGAEE